jgi:hypothetical protein
LRIRGLAAGGLSALLAAGAAAEDEQARLMLELEAPTPGAVIGDPQGVAFVSGKALALYGEYQTFDIVFVIDTSRSTAEPSGADIDGDGKLGKRGGSFIEDYLAWLPLLSWLPLPNSDRGDSILAAEVQAVRTLLGQLDPRTTRVGVVSFAGDQDPMTLDAFTEAALTAEYDEIGDALDGLMRRGPKGQTNITEGLNLAMIELLGTQSAYSTAREDARRIIMFMTDGQPNLPIQNADLQNAKMAIERATRARKFGIRVDTYALGPEALNEPLVTVEMALVTGGVFTPVVRPADLETVFEEITFSDIEKLELANRTNGAQPSQFALNADGSFTALLELQEGPNVVELVARATDGSEGRRQVQVSWAPGAEAQALDARQLAAKNRLLENQLLELQRRSVDIEADRDELLREALREEVRAERKKAEEKAAIARKELEIEAERRGED